MILVISSENDISTDYFMEWCFAQNMDVLRINEKDSFNITHSIFLRDGELDITFEIKGIKITLDQIHGVWFRRGYLYHFSKLEYSQAFAEKKMETVVDFLKNESRTLNDFIIYLLKQKKSLNVQDDYNANKLLVLHWATKVGLNIPDTFITRDIAVLEQSFGKKPLITKTIQDALPINVSTGPFAAMVHDIDNVDDLKETRFYYSKFQYKIDKKYELRIFFIENNYYAGAIFPAKDKTALVNRIVPFLLPDDILNKLKKLNTQLGYNCGSIDMLVDRSNKYYFLEVNPVGQYDYLSKHCNYYLDSKISAYFTN